MTGDWPPHDPNQLGAAKAAEIVVTAQAATVSEEKKSRFGIDAHEETAETDSFIAWATANRQAEIADLNTFTTALYTVSTASVDRSRTAAELVQKASAAIAVLYTGAITLAFSVTDNPLPARGALTPIFLGLAVVLSTAYVAYIGPKQGYSPGPQPTVGLEPKAFERLNAFIAFTHKIATRRSGALRASVVALGVGLVFIAAPFIALGTPEGKDYTDLDESLQWASIEPGAPDPVLSAQAAELASARKDATSAAVDRTGDLIVLLGGLLVGGLLVGFLPGAFKDQES
jgi:hypothetical protein